MSNIKRLIVFAVAGYNLAETGRMLEIAKEAKKFFNIIFISYGGMFEKLIEQERFELIKMNPRLTEKKLKKIRIILSGETLSSVGYFNKKELEPRVENEINLFKKIKPAVVMTGWCLSVTLSSRIAGIPFVNVLHSTSIQEYYKEGLQNWPDRLNNNFFIKLFGEEKLRKRFNNRILEKSFVVKPYNLIAEKYGIPEFNNFIDLIEGDYTLLADIPELVGLEKIRPNVKFVGPLPAKIDTPIPDIILKIKKNKPVIYFAMGSSGKPSLIKNIIEGFKNKPYIVIAPVKKHIEKLNVNVPENVIVTGFIPAHKVNPIADISVIHGGQNTVMQACLSGTPIVGMGMHPEQEANLEACVRKGFAVRLNKWKDKAEDVLKAVEELLNNAEAKKNVIEFKKQLEKWNGPENAAVFLDDTFN